MGSWGNLGGCWKDLRFPQEEILLGGPKQDQPKEESFWRPLRGHRLGDPDRILGAVGGILGESWGILTGSWGMLGGSWGMLEGAWGILGASWGILGGS